MQQGSNRTQRCDITQQYCNLVRPQCALHIAGQVAAAVTTYQCVSGIIGSPQALDEEFPERPLFPADAQLLEQGAKLSAASDELSAAGYR